MGRTSSSQRLEAAFLMNLAQWFMGEESPDLDYARDWGSLFQASTEHYLDRLFAYYCTKHPPRGNVLVKPMRDLLLATAARAAANMAALRDVQHALRSAGIPSLLRKGSVYAIRFYGDVALRGQGDNDLFVPRENADGVASVLTELGFESGSFSYASGTVQPLKRRDRLLFNVNPDHLPPFVRIGAQAFEAPVQIDVGFDLTWYRSPARDVEAMLIDEFAAPQSVAGLETLSDVGHFIDCMLYMYRNAHFRRPHHDDTGVHLRMFLDLALIWRSLDEMSRSKAAAAIRRYRIEQLAGWVSYHHDSVFGLGMSEALGLEGTVKGADLRSFRDELGVERTWQGSMRERLFADRAGLPALLAAAAQ